MDAQREYFGTEIEQAAAQRTGQGRPVAIIGMAGRFPGANSIEELWKKICEGSECLHVSTDEELKESGALPWQVKHKDYVRVNGVMDNPGHFDANFFGFSAYDAGMLDPQHRVLLECAWEAFEDAGYDPAQCGEGVGVFAGSGTNGYRKQDLGPEIDTATTLQLMVATERDFLATRIAFKLGLTGPAITMQTACSTSLVAVEMAYESICLGTSKMAVAGGVSIMLPQATGYIYQPGMILSTDGQCRAFDAKADGTTIGRGAGAVLLKPLEDAIRDRDRIYAVIRGAAINNDGSLKGGYTAPGRKGQTDVVRRAMQMAGFRPETVRYIEAHGTGTEIGDSIEVAALTEAFAGNDKAPGYCTLSSLKPNVGHMDAAAGVANLIKATMVLHTRTMPGTRHFERPNPELRIETTPFRVTNQLQRYTDAAPFRAGVSAFGIGGTNVHVCLEEWREDAAASGTNGHHPHVAHLFPLSANSEKALDAQRERLAAHLETHPGQKLEDIAFTLQAGRRLFPHRYYATAATREELIEDLRAPDKPKAQTLVSAAKDPDVYFLFPGQGAQYVNMGRGLYETDTVFRETIDRCCLILEPILKFDLRTLLFPEPGQEEAATAKLKQAAITPPALAVLEYSLAQRLIASGVVPKAMLGHSLGQYLAATISGVFKLEDVLLLVAERGRLVQSMPNGSMLAVSLSEEEILKQLPPELSIAALNAPKQTIVSGPTEAILAFAETLAQQRVASQKLPTSHAFHSSMLDPITEKAAAIVRQFQLSKPTIPFLSNLTGKWITDEEATSPEYWAQHQRYAVRFDDNLKLLTAKGAGVLIEVGPGETLIGLAKTAHRGNKNIRLASTTRRAISQSTDTEHWLDLLGQLWLAGVKLDWEAIHGDTAGVRKPHRTSLPTYPFERQYYWLEDRFGRSNFNKSKSLGPLIKRDEIEEWLYTRSWRSAPAVPLLSRGPAKSDSQEHWLVLAESDNAALVAVQNGLRRSGIVTSAVPGPGYERAGEFAYSIDIDGPASYAALIDELQKAGNWPTHIVYALRGDAAKDAPNAAYLRLFHLAQALQQSGQTEGIKLHILTDRAYDVLADGQSQAAQTAAASLADVLGLELRGIALQVIDYASNAPAVPLAAQMLQELLAGSDELVALRGRSRWLPEWTQLPLGPAEAGRAKLREGGSYILSGGIGGIGLVLAEHLAKTVSAHLVLVGRTAYPPASEWERLAQDPSAPAAAREKAVALLRIRAAGGTVEVQQGNVQDADRMMEIVHAAGDRLAGIIHAAGVSDFTVVGSTDPETVKRIFAAKAEGTAWIERTIAERKLDFVLLCSSMSAIVPSVGVSAYGAANAYLDGLAARFDDPQGTRVLAVNWDRWSETGMAYEAAAMTKSANQKEPVVEFGITNSEAAIVFEQALTSPVSQVAVSTRDLPRWIESVRNQFKASDDPSRQLALEGDAVVHSRPELSQEYVAPSNETEQAVVEIWQDLLGLDKVGINDDFFELGGHSLLGAQFISRIRERFLVDIPLRIIFETPTPGACARLVIAKTAQMTNEAAAEREEIEI